MNWQPVVALTDIFDDLVIENRRINEELDFADKCLIPLTKFKDELISLLGDRSAVKVIVPISDTKILIDYLREYDRLVQTKEAEDKNDAKKLKEPEEVNGLLTDKTGDNIADTFDDMIEENKDLNRRLISFNQCLEILILIKRLFCQVFDKSRGLVLTWEVVSEFVALNREFEQLFNQMLTINGDIDECIDESEANEGSDEEEEVTEEIECNKQDVNRVKLVIDIPDSSSTIIEDQSPLGKDQDETIELSRELEINLDLTEENIQDLEVEEPEQSGALTDHNIDGDDTVNQELPPNGPQVDQVVDNTEQEPADITWQQITSSNEEKKKNQRSFTCPRVTCRRSFPSRAALVSHTGQSHRMKLICRQCKFSTNCLSTYYGHMNVHSEKYPCKKCQYRASFPHTLKVHERTSHSFRRRLFGEQQSKDVVNNNDLTVEPLEAMVGNEGNQKTFTKDNAKKPRARKLRPVSSKANLVTEELSYKCNRRKCSQIFGSKKEFVDHYNALHYIKFKYTEDSVVRCDICGFAYTMMRNLRRHKDSRHSIRTLIASVGQKKTQD